MTHTEGLAVDLGPRIWTEIETETGTEVAAITGEIGPVKARADTRTARQVDIVDQGSGMVATMTVTPAIAEPGIVDVIIGIMTNPGAMIAMIAIHALRVLHRTNIPCIARAGTEAGKTQGTDHARLEGDRAPDKGHHPANSKSIATSRQRANGVGRLIDGGALLTLMNGHVLSKLTVMYLVETGKEENEEKTARTQIGKAQVETGIYYYYDLLPTAWMVRFSSLFIFLRWCHELRYVHIFT